MYTMLDSHVQHTTSQFAYIQGQITTLSSQIDYMLYSVYKLDHTLLAHVRTMYSTYHKLNESFVCVRVFWVIGIYV